jgi:probable Rubsico expression protein CbbX
MSAGIPESASRPAFGARGPAGTSAAADLADAAPDVIDDGATVDLGETRRRSGVDDVLAALDRELIGLAPVKMRIRQIAALLLVDSQRVRFGLTSVRPNLHMCFTGGPGTGKTTVALRMAELLRRLGYLERGHLVAVTRDDLVGQYVGHTAPKTKEVLKRAMGGVLFIDEAYYLYRADNERDYGQESIEILLQIMENQREDLVVILAGYKDKMDTFFLSNPGMSSRIAHHIDFPDYSLDELLDIGDLMIGQTGYRLPADARDTFRDYLARRSGQPRFANARSVRNAVERARLRHANRLFDEGGGMVTKDELMRLDPGDFLASRVFDQPDPAGDGPPDGP